jgi:hypothetical protein
MTWAGKRRAFCTLISTSPSFMSLARWIVWLCNTRKFKAKKRSSSHPIKFTLVNLLLITYRIIYWRPSTFFPTTRFNVIGSLAASSLGLPPHVPIIHPIHPSRG